MMINLVQFSDPHLVTEASELKNTDTNARFQRCLDDAQNRFSEFDDYSCLVSGDIAHDESSGTYRRFKSWIDTLGVKRSFAIAGNHDDPQLLNREMPDVTPCPTTGCLKLSLDASLRLVLLSSHVAGEVGGLVSEDGMNMIATSEGVPTLVALHHPPLSLSDPEFDAMALRNQSAFWDQVYKNEDVIGVLFGHAHREYCEWRRFGEREVMVMGCPSTAFQYGADNDVPYGFDPSRIGYRRLSYSKSTGLKTEVYWLDT